MNTINLKEKFSLISEHYKPCIIGEVNECLVKAVKFKGEFLWHHHDNEDELFLVVKGSFRMKFRDRERLVREGEFIVVPRGVEHGEHHQRKDGRPARAHLSLRFAPAAIHDQPWNTAITH